MQSMPVNGATILGRVYNLVTLWCTYLGDLLLLGRLGVGVVFGSRSVALPSLIIFGALVRWVARLPKVVVCDDPDVLASNAYLLIPNVSIVAVCWCLGLNRQ